MFSEILRGIGVTVLVLVALLLGGGFLFLFSIMMNHVEKQERKDDEFVVYHNEAQARCEARKQIIMRGLGRPNKQLSPAEWKEYNALKEPPVELSERDRKRHG